MKSVRFWHRWAAVWEPDKAVMYGHIVEAGDGFPPNRYFRRRKAAIQYAGRYVNHDNRFGGVPGHWRIIRKGEQ